jgi:hypothetical protein
MPQALTPIIVELMALGAESAPFWYAVAEGVSYALVAGATYAASNALQKKPDFSSLESQAGSKMQMTKETVPSRRVIYGTQRVSGPIAYVSTSGDKNKDLHLIILLAGHECNVSTTAGHKGVYVNDKLAIDEEGTYLHPYTANTFGALYKWGTYNQTQIESIPSPEWTASDKRIFSNIAYLYVHMIHDPQVYPGGLPNISVLIDGKKVLDPRDSVVKFSDNPALILYDYLKNEFGCTQDELHTASFNECATACDEIIYGTDGAYDTKRYTCNMTFQTSEKPYSIIETILKSCYGKLLYVNGQFQMRVGVASTPVLTLNESDMRDGFSVTTKAPSSEAYNQVTGLFVEGFNETSSFQAAEFVPVTSSYYLAEDNGIVSTLNIDLQPVNNGRIARRLAKLALLDSRQDLVINIPCKPSALRLTAGDLFYMNNTRLGWTNKLFECTSIMINPDLSVDIVAKEHSLDIYDWAESEQDVDRDLSPNTTLTDAFAVDPITNFSASNVPTMDTDGTIFPGIELTWTAPGSASIAKIELDYKNTLEASYTALATLQAGTSTYTTIDVEAGKTYDFRARQYSYFGVYSDYATASLLCIGDNVAPQDPTSMTVTGASGSLYVTWTNPAVDTDYKVTNVKLNTTNNLGTAYGQGSVAGTSWNRTISTSGDYYVWLQNVDTSLNTSSYAYAGYANVPAIGSGASGPSGSAGNIMTDIYKRSQLVPTTPAGNLPVSGWSTTIPADDGNALWVSTGKIDGTDGVTLIGSWSTPKRLSGQASYYQATAPQDGVNATLAYGDLWFDTDDKYTVYRWNGTSWQTVRDADIAPMSASIVNIEGEYTVAIGNGDRVTGFKILTSDASSSFDVQSDRFRIYNVTNGTVTQSFQADANGVYIDEAVIRSLNAGKITAGSISAAVTMSAAYIQGGTIAGNGLYVESTIGIRAKNDSHTLTITGGSDNGSSHGAQIDLTGNSAAGAGVMVLQAGQGGGSGINFLTNQSPSTDVGVVRASVDTYGVFRIERNLSNGSVYTTGAGNLEVEHSLGVGTTANTSNQGQIDATGACNAASFNTPSALRLKTNIVPFYKGLEVISKLQPMSYDLKDGSKTNEVGLIADHVAQVVPNIVAYKDGEVSGMDYARLAPFLISAIHEQQEIIENLRQRLTKIEREI